MSAQAHHEFFESPVYCGACDRFVLGYHACPWGERELAPPLEAVAFYALLLLILLAFWGGVIWGVGQLF